MIIELLTTQEVADILRVDPATVRRWAKQGALNVIVLPHIGERQCYRVRRRTIDILLGEV